MVESRETIFALSTAKGRAALAIVRLSGPHSEDALKSLAGILPSARRATLATIKDPQTQESVDRGLILWLPGPSSFTGEDMAELHLHGGSAVIEATLQALSRCRDCRLALPGEFTRRAFENGRLDLTTAEGIADLIDAETESQRRQALRQSTGGLRDLIDGWKSELSLELAHLEALIDFSDDGIPEAVHDRVRRSCDRVLGEILQQFSAAQRGEIIREGASVAILGPPNSGKSSLLNMLAGRDVAIVSPHAGTTRDVLEVRLNLQGFSVSMADTAGIRESNDPIEEEGVRRAANRAEISDIRVLLFDATRPEEAAAFSYLLDNRTIKVWNKKDLAEGPDAISISSKTGEGLETFLKELESRIGDLLGGPPALVTRARHRDALRICASHLRTGSQQKNLDSELFAEDLRLAVRALGAVTGEVGVEELLDMIFRDFCIGK